MVDIKWLFVFIMETCNNSFSEEIPSIRSASLLASIHTSISDRFTYIQLNLSHFDIENINSSFLDIIHLFM